MLRDEATLLDLVKATRLVQEFTAGIDYAAFQNDVKTQSAVLHQLLILGEAVKRLSDEFCSRHPEIPWRLIASLRDKLIHHYDTVDFDEVWRVVERDIPRLAEQIEPLLPSKDS
jgi:uncharacterized protein with HEPN domain